MKTEHFGITVDPSLSGGTNVVKMYINGTLVTRTAPTDGGTYTMCSTSSQKLRIGCHMDASNVATDYYKGLINQFRIHNIAMTATDHSELYNGGNFLDSLIAKPSSCVIAADFNNPTFTTTYSVPDLVAGKTFTQISSTSAGDRKPHWNKYFNPYKISQPLLSDTLANSDGWLGYSNQVGASYSFGTSGLQFSIDHSGTSDPDRNSCEVFSEGSFDITNQTLWLRANNYNWDADGSVGTISHGSAFSVVSSNNDVAGAMITHRSLTTANGYYRVLVTSASGVVTDYETTVTKGKDVFIKISGTTVSFWYNNSGTLTQMGSNFTCDLGNSVRIWAHARDYNAWTAPNQFGIASYKVYWATPTDL